MRIHEAIQSGSYPNKTSLAQQLEVSLKSIQRDLDFMRDRMDFPIAYDEKKWGYYYTRPVTAFPTFTISEGELFAVLVAEKAMQQYRGSNFEKPLMSAFRKMAAALPDTVTLHMADWEETISFRSSVESISNIQIFDRLSRATAEGRQLLLKYRKPGSDQSEERAVDPYHIANVNGDWFLFGHCHLRKDIRTFAPARIESLRYTGQRFQRPKDFSIHTALRDSFGVRSGKDEYLVRIRFKKSVADYIREKKWHSSQELHELKTGEVELTMRLSSLIEVQRWILSWGGEAEPLEPPELRQTLKAAAEKILASLR